MNSGHLLRFGALDWSFVSSFWECVRAFEMLKNGILFHFSGPILPTAKLDRITHLNVLYDCSMYVQTVCLPLWWGSMFCLPVILPKICHPPARQLNMARPGATRQKWNFLIPFRKALSNHSDFPLSTFPLLLERCIPWVKLVSLL